MSPSRTALVYPARGVRAQTSGGQGGVAQLIGATKVRLLTELRAPATPTQLAALLDLSLGTIAKHLAALSDAGVISAQRQGRAVYYELTTDGERLLDLVIHSSDPQADAPA